MLLQAYNIMIDRDFIEPGHDRQVVDGIKNTNKVSLQAIDTVQLTSYKHHSKQMEVHYSTKSSGVSLEQ